MAYDFEGNRIWLSDSQGGSVAYGWYNQRLQSMAMTTAESKTAQVGFGYDSVGRLASLSRVTNGDPSTTITTSFTLDLLDRVTDITHSKLGGAGAATLSQFSYTYDANGRVVASTGPEGSLSFALDANGQLLSVTGSRSEAYAFDTNGNRTPMPDDWPFMGSVISAKRPLHPYLPNAVTLPEKPSKLPYTRPGQFGARLGVEYDPLYVLGTIDKPLVFTSPSISLDPSLNPARLQDRQSILEKMDAARRQLDHSAKTQTWDKLQAKAMSLLASAQATKAFDVASEPEKIRQRYGSTTNATSLLLARRLVEAGVPFVTVFWLGDDRLDKKCKSGGGWDTHGNNFNCLKENLLPEFDRGFSALVEDLAERGLLETTLLMVSTEMGRKPKVGDPRSGGVNGAGRDHWTHCLSVLLAGGGIKGGQIHGASDKRAEYPEQQVTTPADITKTVYHAMNIENLEARDKENRPYELLAEGSPLLNLF